MAQESFIIVTKSEKERAEWLAAFYREITWAKLAYALEKVLMQEAFQVRYFLLFFFLSFHHHTLSTALQGQHLPGR